MNQATARHGAPDGVDGAVDWRRCRWRGELASESEPAFDYQSGSERQLAATLRGGLIIWVWALKPAETRAVESPGNCEEESCQQLHNPLATDQPAEKGPLKLIPGFTIAHNDIHIFENVKHQ